MHYSYKELVIDKSKDKNDDDISMRLVIQLTDIRRDKTTTLAIKVIENNEMSEIGGWFQNAYYKSVIYPNGRFYKTNILFYYLG